MNGRRGEVHAAVNKAAGRGPAGHAGDRRISEGRQLDCAINATIAGSYEKAVLVSAGKLKATGGVYGIRFAHNTEATLTGLTVTKP